MEVNNTSQPCELGIAICGQSEYWKMSQLLLGRCVIMLKIINYRYFPYSDAVFISSGCNFIQFLCRRFEFLTVVNTLFCANGCVSSVIFPFLAQL